MSHTQLWFQLPGGWIPLVSIPREDFAKFSTKPLKWLRYLGSTIYGREGILKEAHDGPEMDEYTIEDTGGLLSDYFYQSTSPPRFVDMNMIDKLTTSRVLSSETSCPSFDEQITSRDQACAVTGTSDFWVQSAHIVLHKRGDAYIERLTRLRGESERDVIEDIDDLRNGILLCAPLQKILRCGDIAFLKTPNFAMTPDDVPRIPEYPILRAGTQPPHLPTRWTLQYFNERRAVKQVQERIGIYHNADLWAPDDLAEWPADFFFDMLYGCVALHTWGSKEGIETIRRVVPEDRYNISPDPDPESVHQGELEVMDVEMDHVELQRETGSPICSALGDTVDGLLNLWQGFDLRCEPEGQHPHSACPMEIQEKVSNWLSTQ